MFDHEFFDNYSFEKIPLNRDLYAVEAETMEHYEQNMLGLFDGGEYDYSVPVSPIAARSVDDSIVRLSWYPNHFDRFHEVRVDLPRTAFRACVGCWRYDEKPRIFVEKNWLFQLYRRSYTAFGLVDAIGVKEALRRGDISLKQLLALRRDIDKVAAALPNVFFTSFADSVLLKANWKSGFALDRVESTYQPEQLIVAFGKLAKLFQRHLGLRAYGVFAQGYNLFDFEKSTHLSKAGSHLSLNSLGAPFAQLQAIEHKARQNVRNGVHPPCDLYADGLFYHSLQIGYEIARRREEFPRCSYESGFGTESYYAVDLQETLKGFQRYRQEQLARRERRARSQSLKERADDKRKKKRHSRKQHRRAAQ